MGTLEDKFVAFWAVNYEFETFKTFKEAEEWLNEMEVDVSEPYSEEAINGKNYIAKITHRSKYDITDEKSNYTQEELDDGEWPYQWDSVGTLLMENLTTTTKQGRRIIAHPPTPPGKKSEKGG